MAVYLRRLFQGRGYILKKRSRSIKVILFDGSEDAGPDDQGSKTGEEVVFGVVFVVPRHFVELQGSGLSLGPRVGLGEVAISAVSLAGPFVKDSSFMQPLNEGDLGLFFIEKLGRFGEIFHISGFIVKSSSLVSISFVQRSVLQLFQSAHITDKLLPVHTRDEGAFVGVFEFLGDITHRKDQSVPVFMVLIFAGHKGEDVVKARLVELELRD
jgi:hypothetical protein